MKKLFLTSVAVLCFAIAFAQTNTFPSSGKVGIGTLTPNSSALLDMVSTNSGVLVPRMTMAQRDSIILPATGLLIFQTDVTPGFYYFNGTIWTTMGGANKNLSNLSSTSINASLFPDANQIRNIGSSSANWNDIYVHRLLIDNDAFLSNGGSSSYNSILIGATNNINNTGTDNVFAGNNAGKFNTTGSENTFVGVSAGFSNTTGSGNSFYGMSAGYSNSTGINNCFYGYSAGYYNTTGSTNSYYGYKCGMYNTTGYDNTSVGNETGHHNTTGYDNAFFGSAAGHENTTGNSNTFAGFNTGRNNTSGSNNTFLGMSAGMTNTTASDNVFVGTYSGKANVSGSNNVYVGDSSGYKIVSGNRNTFVGNKSGFDQQSGSDNTFIGNISGKAITTGSGNTFVGAGLIATADISGSIIIGSNFTTNQSNIVQIGGSTITRIGIGKSPDVNNILDFAATTAKLTSGGVWTNASDRRLKNNFRDLDAKEILDKVSKLPIQRWHYLADPASTDHIGPVAQDFYQLFQVGDDTTISTIDPSGIALVAIQALTQKSAEKDELIAQRKTEIEKLKGDVTEMQQSLSQCCSNYQQSQNETISSEQGDVSSLGQTSTNSFNSTTLIKCFLPSASNTAEIKIFNLEGIELKSFSVFPGNNTIALAGGTLPAGEYDYSLVIDGRKVDSKRITLTN